MKTRLLQPVALALLLGSASLAQPIAAQSYLTGDFHQHTTYTDGSYTIGHMMSKNNQFGLQWWANSEHGGGFTTNARVTGLDTGNTVYWDSYVPNPILGTVSMSGGHQKMWRWQMLRDSSFTEILKARLLYPTKTILQSYEMNVPGHEHGSMGLINNQFLPTPNCSPIAQFEFMFDNSDADLTGGVAQGWTKSALSGHDKTLEALAWLNTNYPTSSYLVPAHPERKPQASGGYTIAAFRDMNNTAPTVCFGFESMPGHQKDAGRGGYSGSAVGGGTFGGCGFFSAPIGGLWDALLSEGRNFWLFANSDSHNEVGDFYPGEYQKNYTYTTGKSAQNIVDGLRSGNTWVVEGDLIDSLIYKVETIGTEKITGVMGSSMVINKGKSVKITIKARDPQGNNFNTYSPYTNPELNHIDIIKGKVTGKIDPASPNYNVQTVTTTSVIGRFDAVGGVTDTKSITSQKWTSLGNGWVEMSMIVPNVTDSIYFRLRGSNLGLNVTNETDADGNPLADALMGANDATKAFADLWFYSNPIFVYTTLFKAAKFQIKQASDDLEERIAPETGQTQTNTVGSVDSGSSDLELGCEGSANASPQLIGLRFPGISLPKDKVINNAYIEMEVDVASSKVDPCNLIITSEDNDNPLTFPTTASALTSRPKSTSSVAWNVDANSLNVVDQRYYSANIVSLVQANLNRSGWSTGNAMAFFIKGSGRREMESYDGESSAAAALVIEYVMNEQDIKDMQAADETAYLASLPEINMIYTSDSHYGITRASFQGATTVNAQVVNAAMVAKMNGMSTVVLPNDNGVKANQPIGAIDFVINTGDIANRQESPVQSAAASWAQFSTDYINGLTLKNSLGQNAKLLLTPGNHDVSNAIGYTKALNPAIDKTSVVNMYNMMLNPSVPKTTADYDYTTDKINYSKNIGGVHFMFVTLWPDSTNRIWMANDLASISPKMPVVIFTHDQPAIEMKHLRNPNVGHTINGTDKFENMVEEVCKDGLTATSSPTTIEQRGFASFVKSHPNIKAYFHGNSNWNQFYTYTGPDNDIALRTIRIDSPMKGEGELGNNSTTDDKKLSYQVLSLDPVSKNMTVRQCLWNPTATAGAPVQWGASITFALSVADSLAADAQKLAADYTVPSFTSFKKEVVTLGGNTDSELIANYIIAKNKLVAKEMPYSISTSFNGSPTSQLGFAWYNNAGVTGAKVEIVAGNSSDFSTPLMSVDATSTSLNDVNYNVSGNNLTTLAGIASNSKRNYVSNKALATGLTPNTTYSYRVGKTGAWSEVGTFTTAKANKDAFSFIYTTDPQANAVDMFDISQKTTHAADAMYPNANFWLSCGDLIETSGSTNSEWEYEQFFATQQDIFMKKPFAAVIGNHDKSANKNFTNHFNTAGPAFDATSTTPGSIYSYVYGDALFMALSFEDYSVTGRLTEIADWMRAQVAANPDVKWRIVHYHKTIYTGSGSHQSDADAIVLRDQIAPIFDELKINLALQGHDHIYEVMGPIKAKALVNNSVKNQIAVTFDARTNVTAKMGGLFNTQNGTLYFLNNSAGRKKYEPRSQSQMAAVEAGLGLSNYFGMFSGRFAQTGNPTFSSITVSTDTIEVKTFEVSDLGVATPFDSFKVVKTTDFITGAKTLGANGNDAISVYPVPVKDYAYITFAKDVKAKVDVYSMNGSLINSTSINGSSQIDLSNLSKGNYMLKVNAGNDNYSVKFIKE